MQGMIWGEPELTMVYACLWDVLPHLDRALLERFFSAGTFTCTLPSILSLFNSQSLTLVNAQLLQPGFSLLSSQSLTLVSAHSLHQSQQPIFHAG